ncbi:MAG: aminotransferase class III-fold pyridoxal phosphate-dependent enzyme [Bifidobacteriaceae bacterium]|jgi:taurine--2-oxoglutarate transaminase|nr:aminotransferase class III-fold pyridoxal phosphate-dependent enzyme [Bifidobacteriaceae bacterium]
MADQTPATGAALDAAVIDRDHRHVITPWSAQANRPGFHIAGGKGAELWDHAGNRWIDFSSQLVNANIGYGHPRVVEAIQRQAATLATIQPSTANLARAEAAEAILRHTPGAFSKILFTNAGADAVENAIRLARLATGRDKVVSFYRSYHGNTGAAIVATGDWRRIPNEYARGHLHVFGPYLYRSEFGAATPEEESARALRHLRRTVEAEGPETIAALLFETIPGTAGVLVPPPGYLKGVRQIADEFGIVLILDEVMAGFGRAGSWFAFEQFDVMPDLITFAKGVNSGYVPAGGVAVSEPIADLFEHRVFPGGLTYSGHPLAMAAIAANIAVMEEEALPARAARLGAEVIRPALESIAQENPLVGEVRGRVAFWAAELVRDQSTRAPAAPATMALVGRLARERGILPIIAENRIHIAPPLVMEPEQALRGLEILKDVLAGAVPTS